MTHITLTEHKCFPLQDVIRGNDSDSQSVGDLDLTGDSLSLSSKSGSTGEPDTPRVSSHRGAPLSRRGRHCWVVRHLVVSTGLMLCFRPDG